MKLSIIEEERRRKISRGTKAALAARKAEGMRLGGLNAQSIRNRDEARERAELLRPVLAELAGMPARAIARELTARGVLVGTSPPSAATSIPAVFDCP